MICKVILSYYFSGRKSSSQKQLLVIVPQVSQEDLSQKADKSHNPVFLYLQFGRQILIN